jgi:hypothetical protein
MGCLQMLHRIYRMSRVASTFPWHRHILGDLTAAAIQDLWVDRAKKVGNPTPPVKDAPRTRGENRSFFSATVVC